MSLLYQIGFILLGTVAVIYSSAGFGGGSSYLSIMALMNIPYQTYPTLALICNLIVVTGSSIRFVKNKMVKWKKIISWTILSIPMAFVGGLLHLPEKFFLSLLATLLFITGIRIILNTYRCSPITNKKSYTPHFLASISIGAFLGFISGIVGIGGGIFLSPIMTYWKMDKAKNIAISTTLFIFVNSLAALIGKLHNLKNFKSTIDYWPILIIVFAGGQIGNRWCVYKATDKQLTTLTGALSIMASLTLLYKLF